MKKILITVQVTLLALCVSVGVRGAAAQTDKSGITPKPAASDTARYYLAKRSWSQWDQLLVARDFLNVPSGLNDTWQQNACLIPPLADWMLDTANGKFPAPKKNYAAQHDKYTAAQVQWAYARLLVNTVADSKVCPTKLQAAWIEACNRTGWTMDAVHLPAKFATMDSSSWPADKPKPGYTTALKDAHTVMVTTLRDFFLAGRAANPAVTARAIQSLAFFPEKCGAEVTQIYAPYLEQLLQRSTGVLVATTTINALTAMRPTAATANVLQRFIGAQDSDIAIAAINSIGAIARKGNPQSVENPFFDLILRAKQAASDAGDKAVVEAAYSALKSYPQAIYCRHIKCQETTNP